MDRHGRRSRRQWLRRAAGAGPALLVAALGGAALLPGCGFALRRTPPMPFSRIALVGFSDTSPLARELRARLAEQVQVVPAPAQAEVLLHMLSEERQRSVVASTAAGQVRDLTLRVRVGFRLATVGGRELIGATTLSRERDLTYNESQALAKAQEEAELYAAMQSDLVRQVLDRLSRAPQP